MVCRIPPSDPPLPRRKSLLILLLLENTSSQRSSRSSAGRLVRCRSTDVALQYAIAWRGSAEEVPVISWFLGGLSSTCGRQASFGSGTNVTCSCSSVLVAA